MKRASRIGFVVIVLVVGVLAAGIAILKSLDFNEYRGLVAEKVKEAIGRDLKIDGDLKLDISFHPKLTVEGVSLANAPWGSRPEMVTLKRLSAEVELWPLLSGEARVTRIDMVGLDALLEVDAAGHGNWEFNTGETSAKTPAGAPAASAKSSMPIVPVVKDIVIENAKVTYRDAKGATYEAVLDNAHVTTDGLNDPIRLSAKGRVSGVPMSVDGDVGSFAQLLGGAETFPLKVTAKAFDAQVSADGSLTRAKSGPGVDLGIKVSAPDLGATVASAASALPALAGATAPKLPIDLAARARASGANASLDDIRLTFGKTDIEGRVVVDAAGKKPRIDAAISSKLIDVAGLAAAMPKPPAGSSQPAAGGSAGSGGKKLLFPNTPLPFDALRAVDATATVRAQRIDLPGGLSLDDTGVNVDLAGGKLRVAPIKTGIAGGTVDGAVTLNAAGSPAAVNVRLAAADIAAAKLLAEMGKSDLLEGAPTQLEVKLDGRGDSVRQIMAGLDGNVTLKVGEGRIRNAALDVAGADVLSQLAGALNPMAKKEDYSILSCAAVRFQVKDGMAKADKGIAAETDKMNVVGSGDIDLKTEKIDFAVVPEAKQGLGINLGGTVAGLVRVKGTLADPTVGLDQMGAAKTAASIGAAIATGGLSVLGEALINKQTQDPHPCLTALGEAPPPASQAPAAQPSTAAPAEKPASGPANVESDVKGAVEGMGKALKGLFGGGK